jgi:CheY-like chemotaxis protein
MNLDPERTVASRDTVPARAPHPPAAAARSRRLRVLVVNAAPSDLDAYSSHFREAGFDVHAAADGIEALARAVACRPDAIVIDAAVPTFDGWEFTRRLKSAAATRDIPVVVVSAQDPVRAGDAAAAAGCAALLVKPCRPEDLRAEVERQLDQYRPRPRRRGRAGRG